MRCLLVGWRVVRLALLCMLLVGLKPELRGKAAEIEQAQLTQASVRMEGIIPLVAPGGAIPLHWVVAGGNTCQVTNVLWDVVSRPFPSVYPYRYRTRDQAGGMGSYFDYIIPVPAGTDAIYVRPYAVVDGVPVYGAREWYFLMRRAINAGSPNERSDSTGLYWWADTDYIRNWYGFEGGSSRSVTRPIEGTVDDWIYQTQRVGLNRFRCWLNISAFRMTVEVQFHFAELDDVAAGRRVFDIVLEPGTPNEVVLADVDVAREAGQAHAWTLSRSVVVEDYELTIEFRTKSALPPILNGLVLRGISAVPQRQAQQHVAYEDDDTYVDGTSNYRRSPVLLIGGNGRYHGGLRFNWLQVPQGAIINRAFIEVTAAEDVYKEMSLTIYAEATDHSDSFASQPLVPNRPRTTASVVWQLSSSQPWLANRKYTSPDLRDVIQEVVNRPGWRERNALTLLLIANSQADPNPRKIWARDHDTSPDQAQWKRVWLTVDYTPRELYLPTPAPTWTFTPIPTRTPTPTRTHTPTSTSTATPTATETPTPTSTPTPTAFKLFLPMISRPLLKD